MQWLGQVWRALDTRRDNSHMACAEVRAVAHGWGEVQRKEHIRQEFGLPENALKTTWMVLLMSLTLACELHLTVFTTPSQLSIWQRV